MGGDKRRLAKIIGGATAAFGFSVALLFAGYHLGRSGGYFDARADGYAAQYDAANRQRVEHYLANRTAPVTETRECVEEAVVASREDQRSEQDLSAQREMSQWAFWLLIVTILQMPLTAIGLVFLLQTIWQGREALALQRTAFEAETRPWLTFKDLKVRKLLMRRPEEGKEAEGWWITPVIEVEIFNSGTTPARDIAVLALAVDEPISETTEGLVAEWAKHQLRTGRGLNMGVLPPNGTGVYKSSMPCPLSYHDEHGAERRDMFPGIALAVIYRGMTGETMRQTVQMFRLSNVDPKQHQDTPTAHGFWLTHTTYGPQAITIIVGSKVDQAT